MKKNKPKEATPWTVLNSITFGELLRFQARKIKQDWRIPLLWLVELILAIVLAGSIAIYLDPDINLVPFPGNIMAFVIIASVTWYLHGFTRPFRMSRRMKL